MQFLWKGSQGSDCLKLLGRGLGERILIHTVSVVSHPKQNKTTTKNLTEIFSLFRKKIQLQFPDWNF